MGIIQFECGSPDRTVELPAEYWNEKGQPQFFNEHGYIDQKFLAEKLDEDGGRVEHYSSLLSIDKSTSFIKEKSTQKILAEVTTFRLWGGWVSRNSGLHTTAASCEFIQASGFSRNFYGQLFKPSVSIR